MGVTPLYLLGTPENTTIILEKVNIVDPTIM